ncbi:hypothetical protein HBI56_018270 [Parastagonospora nodorum]|uniref:Uncharacterized protein n=1 Tax=Phaeosphaeria nodorum (strain SN15 / ATCC MYA-4574 / FGSC 10173) TaxID=321614 RepID=A0A7U2F172_PHANO|nr:hypothetical protein HBH56_081710 [Parastagonospora nodorum]QRC96606.1 hypothetical protein JI435_015100 [Parastagonospora nodorum SN15]KAH3929673.1 hypothetical protein HBH54_120130 [Parastagonospora nodorum]KAH4133093.1 hypothetical protein HBH47_008520 [Parastagonospora nodorum]KAH4138052.1 hypothetical protein HBH45_113850 [Parastagonospora nodorum]
MTLEGAGGEGLKRSRNLCTLACCSQKSRLPFCIPEKGSVPTNQIAYSHGRDSFNVVLVPVLHEPRWLGSRFMPVAALVARFDAEGWCVRSGVSSYSYIAMLEVVTIIRPALSSTSKSLWPQSPRR